MFTDGEFDSFAGGADEALGMSNAPQVRDVVLRCESCCECCFEPIILELRNFELISCQPSEPVIHVTETPWDWLTYDMISMCDTTNFALDPDHAERYERMMGRRGVFFTIDQAKEHIRFVAEARLWDLPLASHDRRGRRGRHVGLFRVARHGRLRLHAVGAGTAFQYGASPVMATRTMVRPVPA